MKFKSMVASFPNAASALLLKLDNPKATSVQFSFAKAMTWLIFGAVLASAILFMFFMSAPPAPVDMTPIAPNI